MSSKASIRTRSCSYRARSATASGIRARQVVDDLKVENLREALDKCREKRKQRQQAHEQLREERQKAREEIIAARWAQDQAALFEEYGNEAEQIILAMKAESCAPRSRANIRAKANPYRRPRSPAPENGPFEAFITSKTLESKTAAASVDRARNPRLSARRLGRPTAECFFKQK